MLTCLWLLPVLPAFACSSSLRGEGWLWGHGGDGAWWGHPVAVPGPSVCAALR